MRIGRRFPKWMHAGLNKLNRKFGYDVPFVNTHLVCASALCWRTYKTAFYSPDYLGMVNPHLPLMRAGAQPILHDARDYWIHHYFFRNRAYADAKRARRKLLSVPLETVQEEQWRSVSKKVKDQAIPQTGSVGR